MELRILTRRRAASVFAMWLFSLLFDACSFVGEALFSSKQQQSQPNIFAATVIVLALGHSLHLNLFPSRAASNSADSHEPQSTCILPGVAVPWCNI